jgi:hypothetical protein
MPRILSTSARFFTTRGKTRPEPPSFVPHAPGGVPRDQTGITENFATRQPSALR